MHLVYGAICSLDGYVADEEGRFDWLAPDDELHAFVNDMERPIGTYLYGRRMYEVMVYWEAPPEDLPDVELDYTRVWQAADKVVYSRTLREVSSRRTRLKPEFDPAAVEEMKASASRDLSIGGPTLAAQALGAGLVDEVRLFLAPVVIGGGNPVLPPGWRAKLELLDHRRFASGVVYLRYAGKSQ